MKLAGALLTTVMKQSRRSRLLFCTSSQAFKFSTSNNHISPPQSTLLITKQKDQIAEEGKTSKGADLEMLAQKYSRSHVFRVNTI